MKPRYGWRSLLKLPYYRPMRLQRLSRKTANFAGLLQRRSRRQERRVNENSQVQQSSDNSHLIADIGERAAMSPVSCLLCDDCWTCKSGQLPVAESADFLSRSRIIPPDED